MKPGDIWIDYSWFRPPTPQHPTRFGCKGTVRYIDPTDRDNGKNVSAAEFKSILNAGMDFWLNNEAYATRLREGAPSGAHDGKVIADFAASIGYARGASVVCSDDAQPNPNTFNAIEDYLAAFNHAAAGQVIADVYGGKPLIDEMRRRMGPNIAGWESESPSFSPGVWGKGGVGLWQNRKKWYGVSADENIVQGAFRSHLHTLGVPAPEVATTTAPVPAALSYQVTSDDSDGLAAAMARVGISDWHSVAALNGLSAPFTIHAGDVLRLTGSRSVVTPPSKNVLYTVQPGDTITKIAAKYPSTPPTPATIEDANDLQPPFTIHPGQVLIIR
jgi:nucleoid-associated protein YgaU